MQPINPVIAPKLAAATTIIASHRFTLFRIPMPSTAANATAARGCRFGFLPGRGDPWRFIDISLNHGG
jgi:hypothetical protein